MNPVVRLKTRKMMSCTLQTSQRSKKLNSLSLAHGKPRSLVRNRESTYHVTYLIFVITIKRKVGRGLIKSYATKIKTPKRLQWPRPILTIVLRLLTMKKWFVSEMKSARSLKLSFKTLDYNSIFSGNGNTTSKWTRTPGAGSVD